MRLGDSEGASYKKKNQGVVYAGGGIAQNLGKKISKVFIEAVFESCF